METKVINRTAILKLKNSIKKTVEQQKFLKNQRKTVNLVGPREMDPREAAWKADSTRGVLRIMYAAYAIMRGKDINAIDNLNFTDTRKNLFLNSVNRMVETYEKESEKEVTNEM
jgi:hypothetical protein